MIRWEVEKGEHVCSAHCLSVDVLSCWLLSDVATRSTAHVTAVSTVKPVDGARRVMSEPGCVFAVSWFHVI